jgi:hypothetical protein
MQRKESWWARTFGGGRSEVAGLGPTTVQRLLAALVQHFGGAEADAGWLSVARVRSCPNPRLAALLPEREDDGLFRLEAWLDPDPLYVYLMLDKKPPRGAELLRRVFYLLAALCEPAAVGRRRPALPQVLPVLVVQGSEPPKMLRFAFPVGGQRARAEGGFAIVQVSCRWLLDACETSS